MDEITHKDLGWHVIHGDDLMSMLRRCAKGENPDLVYMEHYVNCDIEDFSEEGEDA